jgi:hypothetical protein
MESHIMLMWLKQRCFRKVEWSHTSTGRTVRHSVIIYACAVLKSTEHYLRKSSVYAYILMVVENTHSWQIQTLATRWYEHLFLHHDSSLWNMLMEIQTERQGFDSRQRQGIFPLAFVSRAALRPTYSPIQWIPGSFPRGKARPRRDANHSLHVVLRSETNISYTSSPHWRLHGGSGTSLLFKGVEQAMVTSPSFVTNSQLFTVLACTRDKIYLEAEQYATYTKAYP